MARGGRVGRKIVTGRILVVPVRAWIAGAPDDGIGRRIVTARDPCRTAAAGRGVVVVLPGLVTRLALARNRKGAPRFLLRRKIGRCEPAADSILCAGNA